MSRVVRSSELQVHTLTELRGLEALESEWRALYARCPALTPFQSPSWLLPWCHAFGIAQVHALALFRGRRLVGLAPCLIYADGGERVLGLLGSGVSDFQDALLDPALGDEGALRLADWLRAQPGWDRLLFEQLAPSSALRALAAAEPEPHDCCPRLELAAGWQLPARLHKNLRQARRRLERAGELRCTHADGANASQLMTALMQLHRARWRERGEPGIFDEPRMRAMQHAVAQRCAADGSLLLYALELAGRAIAVWYGFRGHGRHHYYVGGFDPALRACSPGGVLLWHAVSEAQAEGASSFELLRGREPYKYAWGARDAWNVRVNIARSATPC